VIKLVFRRQTSIIAIASALRQLFRRRELGPNC
jgi:hypothetical protein